MNYQLKDKFADDIDRRGVARVDSTSYKAVLFGSNDQPAIERVISGNRDIIVGNRGESFISIDHAKIWAVIDAETMGLFGS